MSAWPFQLIHGNMQSIVAAIPDRYPLLSAPSQFVTRANFVIKVVQSSTYFLLIGLLIVPLISHLLNKENFKETQI